jgi:two-component system sensor histidine kinase HydH
MISESNEEIARLDRLVGELLGFAKPGVAKNEDVELGSELNATLTFVSQEMQRSRVELRRQIPNHPLVVRLDPTRLRQIMLNLLMNAKEATGEDGQVTVGLVRRGEQAEIQVSDNGPGVSDEHRQHIFEPFYTTKEYGSGLGLALVKRFVEESDGQIDVRTNGSGTTFRVTLPLAASMR